jgi:alpha-L-fucosidase 2
MILLLFLLYAGAYAAPSAFPKSGNGLWFTQKGGDWSREWLPVGNGYLGAMIPGGTSQETTQLNIESLWQGGPFADPSYNGGNKQPSEQAATAALMQQVRQTIFQSPIGEISSIDPLATNTANYGSFAGAGYMLSTLNVTGAATNYVRWLDLDQAIAATTWTQNGVNLERNTFCSNPTHACVEHTSTTNGKTLPAVTYAFSTSLETNLPAPNVTCASSNSLLVTGLVANPGMSYAFIFRAFSSAPAAKFQCIQFPVASGKPPNATLTLVPGTGSTAATDSWITWVGDTNYDMDAGNAAHNFTFRGADPVTKLHALSTTGLSDYKALLSQHVADVKSAFWDPFTLDLGQTFDLNTPTNQLKAKYTIDGLPSTNAYLDWLLFNFGRYLLASSSRGLMPVNLQGKWGADQYINWGSDYHANINLQMNYWIAEMTGLGPTTKPLFDYMEKTWAPRGAYTAKVLYNITRGWVTHNEMNTFGHTGLKLSQFTGMWNDYPESAVWMMFHVWDHFDTTNDVAWWKAQGWPLVKGVASFHLDKLIPDLHFNDSTLVVNPCNSPEQPPITFGCANAQQIIWQLFNTIEKGFAASGDTDTEFLQEVRAKRAKMDKGLKIGSWGQLQEWKVEKDRPTDTHRHLSHLIGLYPGYAITNFDPSLQATGPASGYTRQQVLDATKVSLIHRGNGSAADADAGWEKSWRAAAWAQFGNSSMFYHELSFAMTENFGPNLFSLYFYSNTDPDTIFQIDANLGFPAAMLNALIQVPDVPSLSTTLKITLIPALPTQWAASGSIKGARVRGGITVDFSWKNGKLAPGTTLSVTTANSNDSSFFGRTVQVWSGGQQLTSFVTAPGLVKHL